MKTKMLLWGLASLVSFNGHAQSMVSGIKMVWHCEASGRMPEGNLTQWLTKGHARIESDVMLPGHKKGYLLLDQKTSDGFVVMDSSQSYLMMNNKTEDQDFTSVLQNNPQMQEMMRKNPEMAKKMRESLMARNQGSTAEAEAKIAIVMSGEKRRVGDWNCQVAKMTRNQIDSGELCIASWKDLKVNPSEFSDLSTITKQFNKRPGVNLAGLSSFDRIKDKGFPVEVLSAPRGKEHPHRMTLVSIEAKSFPSTLFQVPPGYHKLSLPDMTSAH